MSGQPLEACLREGHGPALYERRRVWWAPWRTRLVRRCWVCHTGLTADEAARADKRWLPVFEHATELLERRRG